MSASDRQVSYRFVMRLMIALILTCALWLGTVTCQNSQKGVGKDRLQFTANNERTVRALKASSAPKKCFERIIPSRPEFACKFDNSFSSIFQSLQMYCRVFCNLADSSTLLVFKKSGNHDVNGQKKIFTHVAIQVQAFCRNQRN